MGNPFFFGFRRVLDFSNFLIKLTAVLRRLKMEGFFHPSEEFCRKLIVLHGEHARNYLFTSKKAHLADGDVPVGLVQECIQEALFRISGTMWRHAVMNEQQLVTKESVLVITGSAEGYFPERVRERLHLPTNEQGNELLAELFEEIRAWLRIHEGRFQFLSDNEGHVALFLRGDDIVFEARGKRPEPILPPLTS